MGVLVVPLLWQKSASHKMNEKVILTTLGRRYTKVGASFAHWSSSKDTSWFQTSSVFSSVNRDSLRRTQVGNQVSEFLPLLLRVAKLRPYPLPFENSIRTFWHLCPVLRAHKTTLLWPNWSYKKWYFVKFNPTVTSTWKNFFCQGLTFYAAWNCLGLRLPYLYEIQFVWVRI